MTTIKTIPVACLGALDVRQGDTLRILASHGKELVVEIRRDSPGEPIRSGGISKWLRSAKGSVSLEPSETGEDIRLESSVETCAHIARMFQAAIWARSSGCFS